jgi:hypothetical protein
LFLFCSEKNFFSFLFKILGSSSSEPFTTLDKQNKEAYPTANDSSVQSLPRTLLPFTSSQCKDSCKSFRSLAVDRRPRIRFFSC